MRQLPPITIQQVTGRCKGVYVTEPADFVYADTARGRIKLGIVWHAEGSPIMFRQWLKPEMREAVRKRVAELRKENGQAGIASHTSSIPDPRLIMGYLRGERYRKRPTVTQVPNGVPKGKQDERKQLYIPGRD